mgnify:CR=1 FL=1
MRELTEEDVDGSALVEKADGIVAEEVAEDTSGLAGSVDGGGLLVAAVELEVLTADVGDLLNSHAAELRLGRLRLAANGAEKIASTGVAGRVGHGGSAGSGEDEGGEANHFEDCWLLLVVGKKRSVGGWWWW